MPLEESSLHEWTLEVARLERELEKAERHIADLRELREHDARNLAEARAVACELLTAGERTVCNLRQTYSWLREKRAK